MTKPLSFNFFKTKSFKTISLTLALGLTSGLMIATNYQFSTNSVSGDNNKLSGFHITVKENNKNLISESNIWNSINNKYEDFISNNSKQLITETFDKWSDIINQVNIKPADDNMSKDVNSKFTSQITNKDNHILPNNEIKNFTNNIVGRSVAKQSLNTVPSFGDVYVGYHDSLPTQISNGLFATINPNTDFNNYFSVPYTITPSVNFNATHTTIQQRIKVLPLNNANPNDVNQPMVVILAKNSDDEQLMINDKKDGIINSNLISYGLLNHSPSDGLSPTKFKITVKNSTNTIYDKTINLTNNSSNIEFNTVVSTKNDIIKDNTPVAKQYLIKNNPQDNKDTLVVMNQASENVKINFNEQLHQNWLKWVVDPQTLEKVKGDKGTPVNNGDQLPVNEETDFQVYCIGLDTTDLQRQVASEQYIVVYKKDIQVPTFTNCTNFFQENDNKPTTLIAGFKQYLMSSSSSSNNIKIEDLKDNAGELISWFINYQGNITKQNYVNYLNSNIPSNPWNVNETLTIKTLVNNWNVIIICGFVFSLLIVVPIVVVLIRKKKYLK